MNLYRVSELEPPPHMPRTQLGLASRLGKTSGLGETSCSGGVPTSRFGGFACSGGRRKYFLFAREPCDLRASKHLSFAQQPACQIKKSLPTKFLHAEDRLSTRLRSTCSTANPGGRHPVWEVSLLWEVDIPFGRFRSFGMSKTGYVKVSKCRDK